MATIIMNELDFIIVLLMRRFNLFADRLIDV